MAARRTRDFDTLSDQLRAAFYTGEIAAGGKVPSTREIARRMRISPTTALGLYKRLAAEGMIETRLRSGSVLKGVGLERRRKPREVALFRMALQISRRLELLSTSSAEFCELLRRCSGESVRPDFKFGFVMHAEAFRTATSIVKKRLPKVPCVRLSPDATDEADVRAALRGDTTIKCLLATYLYADRALRLARDLRRYMVVVRPDEGSLARLMPGPGEKRYVLTHDRQTATDLRALVRTLFDEEVTSRFIVAALEAEDTEDASLFDEIARKARVVTATAACFKQVSQRYGGRIRVELIPPNLGEGTTEEMLYHYLFA